MLYVADGTVDLLQETTAHEDHQVGVSWSDGVCPSRPDNTSDIALTLSQRALLTVNSAQLYPDSFPNDFSILLVVRTAKGTYYCTNEPIDKTNSMKSLVSSTFMGTYLVEKLLSYRKFQLSVAWANRIFSNLFERVWILCLRILEFEEIRDT